MLPCAIDLRGAVRECRAYIQSGHRFMHVSIAPIEATHISGFHHVVDTVAKERKYLPALEAPPLDSTAQSILGNIDSGQSQLVALDGEKVVGWCDILSRSDPVRQHVGVVGMGLLPQFRACGLGRRLLSATLKDARRHAFRRIELKARASNAPAIALYRRLGFAHEGTLKDDVFIDGAFDSTHCMALFPQDQKSEPR